MTNSPAFQAGLVAWHRSQLYVMPANPYPVDSREHAEFNEGLATANEVDELERLPASAFDDERDTHL